MFCNTKIGRASEGWAEFRKPIETGNFIIVRHIIIYTHQAKIKMHRLYPCSRVGEAAHAR